MCTWIYVENSGWYEKTYQWEVLTFLEKLSSTLMRWVFQWGVLLCLRDNGESFERLLWKNLTVTEWRWIVEIVQATVQTSTVLRLLCVDYCWIRICFIVEKYQDDFLLKDRRQWKKEIFSRSTKQAKIIYKKIVERKNYKICLAKLYVFVKIEITWHRDSKDL